MPTLVSFKNQILTKNLRRLGAKRIKKRATFAPAERNSRSEPTLVVMVCPSRSQTPRVATFLLSLRLTNTGRANISLGCSTFPSKNAQFLILSNQVSPTLRGNWPSRHEGLDDDTDYLLTSSRVVLSSVRRVGSAEGHIASVGWVGSIRPVGSAEGHVFSMG